MIDQQDEGGNLFEELADDEAELETSSLLESFHAADAPSRISISTRRP